MRYIWNFFVYAGSDKTYLEKYMDLPVTSRIVFSLLNPCGESGIVSTLITFI